MWLQNKTNKQIKVKINIENKGECYMAPKMGNKSRKYSPKHIVYGNHFKIHKAHRQNPRDKHVNQQKCMTIFNARK